jgi:ribonucleotide monophosphatase NagD (HAD superfamily)
MPRDRKPCCSASRRALSFNAHASAACDARDAVMVGDDAEADLADALKAGIGSAPLVRMGKYRPGDEEKVEPAPQAKPSPILPPPSGGS